MKSVLRLFASIYAIAWKTNIGYMLQILWTLHGYGYCYYLAKDVDQLSGSHLSVQDWKCFSFKNCYRQNFNCSSLSLTSMNNNLQFFFYSVHLFKMWWNTAQTVRALSPRSKLQNRYLFVCTPIRLANDTQLNNEYVNTRISLTNLINSAGTL